MKKPPRIVILFLFILAVSFPSGLVWAANSGHDSLALGIDRSNLTRQNDAVLTNTLQGVHALNAVWFRDVLSGSTPQTMDAFVHEVAVAKQNNLKFLANILPASADYDAGYQSPNAGEDFRKRCGWPQGSSEISKISPAKLAQRLRTQFDAVKKAGLTIDAFEIGNEIDWICFNGDVPNGHEPTEEELMTTVRGYARFLKTAAEVIRDPRYFPAAKIITFGIAHSSDQWDKPVHHFSNPARLVAMLRNLDGFNYLDNAEYHVDGYGTHIYTGADNIAKTASDKLRQDAAILGRNKPFWVTEWGLTNPKAFPNKEGQTLNQGLEEFLETFGSLNKEIPLGPILFYSYNNWLTDDAGQFLPLASVLSVYGSR